jgi:penicillin-binding protein 1A
VAVPLALAAIGLGGAAAFESSCTLKSLRPAAIGHNSFVYAADGTLLGSIPSERNRQPVPLASISPWMRRATVAIEDRRFYEHGGVDYEGIARALWRDVEAGRVVEGGSTITQQLVRNLYISGEVTLDRKVKEACLAIKLSRAWPKNRILASYMNHVYYGNHAYGIEAAAQTYFSRRARNLTLLQAAFLAGLPQAPTRYNPFVHPERALARRDAVLRALLENGDIGRAQYREAHAVRGLRLNPGKLYSRIREPYFFNFVRDQLVGRYGERRVRSGGLRVYTTVDPRLQVLARRAIQDTLYYSTDPAAAIVAINPANGAIRAMTAVIPDRPANQFNLAAQARRQAGSTFKTFVLAAAVDQGINPASTVYVSAPFRYQRDASSEVWDVSTYSHSYSGPISVEQATLASDNTVYAQLTLDVGPAYVAGMARKLGVRSPLEAVPSVGLGAIAVSPLDMASAYATLAAEGVYSKPMAIRKVVLPSGEVDAEAGWGRRERRRVLSEGEAYVVTKILEDNMLAGTGVGAYFGRTAAGKTGTTDEHADAWFCGYTPNLAATVWVGYPSAETPMESVHGIAVAGGTFPAEIWRRFMQPALGGTPPLGWQQPSDYPVWRSFTPSSRGVLGFSDEDDDDYDYDYDYSPSQPAAPSPRPTTPSPPRPQAPASPPAATPPPAPSPPVAPPPPAPAEPPASPPPPVEPPPPPPPPGE